MDKTGKEERRDKIDDDENLTVKSKNAFEAMGDLVESPATQAFLVILNILHVMVVVYTVTSQLERYDSLTLGVNVTSKSSWKQLKKDIKVIQGEHIDYEIISITQVIFYVIRSIYTLEMLLVMIAFKTNALLHIGYFLDTLDLSLFLYSIMYPDASNLWMHWSLLVRSWRAFRLWKMEIIRLEDENDNQAEVIQGKENRIQRLEGRIKCLQDREGNELDAVTNLETTVMSQYDQIEELREALKIASETVAEISNQETIDISKVSEIAEKSVRERETPHPGLVEDSSGSFFDSAEVL